MTTTATATATGTASAATSVQLHSAAHAARGVQPGQVHGYDYK